MREASNVRRGPHLRLATRTGTTASPPAADYRTLNAAQRVAEADPFCEARYVQFSRHLPHGVARVLDVGCSIGTGGAALRSQRPELELVGLDLLDRRLARLPPGTYRGGLCGLATTLPLRAARFDAIVAGEFIEHLRYADVLPTLAEFRRILRPGGTLLMTTPNPDSLMLKARRASMLGGAHLSAHYPKQLAQMLAEVGFGPASWCGSGKASRLVGERFPYFDAYGSYLIRATS